MFSLVFTNSNVGLLCLASASLNEFNWPLMLVSPNQCLGTIPKKREGLGWTETLRRGTKAELPP